MRLTTLLLTIFFVSFAVYGQNYIRSGEYLIISAVNEKVLDVSGGKKDNGVNVIVWESNGNPNQEFEVEFEEGGAFTMTCVNSDKVVAIDGNSNKDMANVVQWEDLDIDAQKFKLEPVENTEMFMIVNVQSGKALTVDPNSGNVVQMPVPSGKVDVADLKNQSWIFSQRVNFKNANANKYLDVSKESKDNGAKLNIWNKNNKKNQAYDMIPILNSEEYYIRSVHSKKYLTVSGGNLTSGAAIEQRSFSGEASQRFLLDGVSDHTYYIIPAGGSNLVLDVKDKSKKDGGHVVLGAKQPTASQHWAMYKDNPKGVVTQVKDDLKKKTNKAAKKIKGIFKK